MHSDGGHVNGEVKFEVSETLHEGVPVLGVTGEVDVSTSPQLRDRLSVQSDKGPLVVVDLTAVSFVDSTALGVLVSALERLRDGGGDLRLVVTQPHIAKVFDITGLTDIFAMYHATGEAVRG